MFGQITADSPGFWAVVNCSLCLRLFLDFLFISCLVHVRECNIHKIICFGVEKNNNNGEWNCTAMNISIGTSSHVHLQEGLC